MALSMALSGYTRRLADLVRGAFWELLSGFEAWGLGLRVKGLGFRVFLEVLGLGSWGPVLSGLP